MYLADFDFHLPSELIAQNPATPRDAARLLVVNREKGTLTHAHIKDLPHFLPAKATIVANNSRVRHSRLWARIENKTIEVLILEPRDPTTYQCLLRGKGLKPGMRLTFYQDDQPLPLTATIQSIETHPAMTSFILHFESTENLETLFERYGAVPLPPYITESTAHPDQYQTVFAKETGSAAAPTAGLHFTPELLATLQSTHAWLEVTLHVGMGTFLPLRRDSITDNALHSEATYIAPEVAQHLNQDKKTHTPVLAVGTTSTRTLESHTRKHTVQSGWQNTDLFIYPGFVFQTTSMLMTNFHLPKSSLLVLVAAFLGNNPLQQKVVLSEKDMIDYLQMIYQTAIQERYRFFSFGDAMLIV